MDLLEVMTYWYQYIARVGDVPFYIFCAIAALNLVLALATIFLGCIFPVSSPGYSMDFYISVGTLALMASILIQGLDPVWTVNSAHVLESLCQIIPAVIAFAWLWIIGGLLMKPCALTHYHRYTEGAKLKGQEWKPNLWLMLLMLIGAVGVIVWVTMFPHQLTQIKFVNITQEERELGITFGGNEYLCRGQYDTWWRLAFEVFYAALLILALLVSYVAVYVARKRPTRSDAIITMLIIHNIILVLVAMILVAAFLEKRTFSSLYSIMSGLEMYLVFFTLLLLLIGKIIGARRVRGTAEDNYAEVDEKGVASSYHGSSRYESGTPEPRAEVFTY